MTDNDKLKLNPHITLLAGCSIIVGSIVGSGIFIAARTVLETAGTPALTLLVWFTAGIISLIGAICFTELGTLIQTSGGTYAYINEAYGHLPAFLYTWMMVFVAFPALNAVASLTISMYLVQFFYPTCEAPQFVVKIIAALVICILGVLNSFDMKNVSRIQITFTLTKVAAIMTIVAAGVWTFVQSSKTTSDMIVDWIGADKPYDLNNIALALHTGLFGYSGWNCLNFLTSEMINPTKNLPRAIYISIPLVIFIYLSINIAYFVVLSPQDVLRSKTVATTFSEHVFPKNLAWLTPVFIAFSTFGSLGGLILSTSRIYYAAARDGNLPRLFSMINLKYYSPITSLVLVVATSISMLLVDQLETLILYGTFSEFFFNGIAISTVLYFRYERPNAYRPIKVFIGFPIFFILICIFMVGLTAFQYRTETLTGFIILLTGIPVYYISVAWKNKPITFEKYINAFTVTCQQVFICSESDE